MDPSILRRPKSVSHTFVSGLQVSAAVMQFMTMLCGPRDSMHCSSFEECAGKKLKKQSTMFFSWHTHSCIVGIVPFRSSTVHWHNPFVQFTKAASTLRTATWALGFTLSLGTFHGGLGPARVSPRLLSDFLQPLWFLKFKLGFRSHQRTLVRGIPARSSMIGMLVARHDRNMEVVCCPQRTGPKPWGLVIRLSQLLGVPLIATGKKNCSRCDG